MICKVCGQEFDRKVYFKIHKRLAHLPEKRRYDFYFWNVKKDKDESTIPPESVSS